jgi:Rrf2 family protein
MVTDTRFAVATHAMSVLAFMGDQSVSATFIGEQISINPVIIRRTLSLLGKEGLVKSSGGSKGGFQLTRSPTKISLLDIYRAIHPKRPFEKTRGFPKSTCVEGQRVDKVLIGLFNDADSALEKVLAQKTLADVLEEARRRL